MGRDKSLLPFDSYDTLTEYQFQRLKKIFKFVYISCKDKSKFDFEADFIEDVDTQGIYAPTFGFISIYKKLQNERFFVISVDTPFVTELELKRIFDEDQNLNDVTIAKTGLHIHSLCGIYHRSLEQAFIKMKLTGKHKLGYLLENSNTKYVEFKNETKFINLNYFNEYIDAKNNLK